VWNWTRIIRDSIPESKESSAREWVLSDRLDLAYRAEEWGDHRFGDFSQKCREILFNRDHPSRQSPGPEPVWWPPIKKKAE
ncbi:hypothetical protein ACFL4W_05100, partial [Planctomycetota bacterium]